MKEYISKSFTLFINDINHNEMNEFSFHDSVYFDMVITENKNRIEYDRFNLSDFNLLLEPSLSYIIIDKSPYVASYRLAVDINMFKSIRRTLESKFKNISNIFSAYDSCLNELNFIQNEIRFRERKLTSYANQMIDKYSSAIGSKIKSDVESIINLLFPTSIIEEVLRNDQNTYRRINQGELSDLVLYAKDYSEDKLNIMQNIRNLWPRFYVLQELRNRYLFDIQSNNNLGRKRTIGLEDLVLKKWPLYLEQNRGNKSKTASMIIQDYMLKYIGKDCSPKTVLNTVKRLEKEERLSQQ